MTTYTGDEDVAHTARQMIGAMEARMLHRSTELNKLREENERLRAALLEIFNTTYVGDPVYNIALSALKTR